MARTQRDASVAQSCCSFLSPDGFPGVEILFPLSWGVKPLRNSHSCCLWYSLQSPFFFFFFRISQFYYAPQITQIIISGPSEAWLPTSTLCPYSLCGLALSPWVHPSSPVAPAPFKKATKAWSHSRAQQVTLSLWGEQEAHQAEDAADQKNV